MGQEFAITGWPGLLVVGLPIVALACVVLWAVLATRRRPGARKAQTDQAGASVTLQRPQANDMAGAAQPPAHAKPPPAPTPASGASTASAVAPALPRESPAVSLTAAIASAEKAGDKAQLATLYVRQAQALMETGDNDKAASRLRDAIGIAALNRLPEPHALARLELGDLYLRQGDPITACEQWQIARQLFYNDLSRKDDGAKLDRRMLDNGCPTDWVLTDF